jgi:hypothetical protein
MDPESVALMLGRQVDDILAKIEVRATDLHTRKWASLEDLMNRKRIKTVDREAFHKFYTDTMETVSTSVVQE